ncbi:MAG: T9SS type A sorting domain-containing protein [Bacteroidetes bacterium]|nr:T9SS type A sorting domain-containing protein [Bacteroidota bacterium]
MMPSWNISSMPNFPNYDLGPLQGSPCDTLYLGSNEHLINGHSFRISPNPASDWFNIVYETDDDISFVITDGYGREVKRLTLYPWFKNRIVYVDDLPAGIYLLTLSSQSRKQTMKLIVAK